MLNIARTIERRRALARCRAEAAKVRLLNQREPLPAPPPTTLRVIAVDLETGRLMEHTATNASPYGAWADVAHNFTARAGHVRWKIMWGQVS